MSARDFGSECIVPSHLRLTRAGRPVIGFSIRGSHSSVTQVAARVAYRLYIGETRKEQVVSHRCGNNVCINPAHLYLRDFSEACADNGNNVLTAKDYWYVRRSPLSLGQLSKKLNYER